MARNCLSLQTKFSMRWRALYSSLSKSRGVLRLLLGGITGVLPAVRRGSITRSSASNALSANTVSALICGRSASAPSRSCAWPGVRKNASGLPSASTIRWIFVLNPPLLRPIAWFSLSFFERQHCVGGHARWYCRSWRIHCQHRLLTSQISSSRLRFLPNGKIACGPLSDHRSAPAGPAREYLLDSGREQLPRTTDCPWL